MIYKRRLYIVAIVLAVFFATVMFAFIAQKDQTDDFKGTLVRGYTWEAVI
ncbi:hypothetical protein Ana3638_00955 [Anaerocolumna sedimenticola]|uniref:Uncharacterized protein n=1 Tax=Anaerocolumna sedimenticola TaxID=2696063 RepID=A0A6P1THI3_9FIRM|nr:hypothetical protein [Anaerocolumna sedimenticola]QHQ59539.1 hypothetical protein Ana3638_00955 [Anaerocolumna sedimenticola]